MQVALEAGEGNEPESPLGPSEGAQPCQHLDFGPGDLFESLTSRTTREQIGGFKFKNLSCFKCVRLLQQQKGPNTPPGAPSCLEHLTSGCAPGP